MDSEDIFAKMAAEQINANQSQDFSIKQEIACDMPVWKILVCSIPAIIFHQYWLPLAFAGAVVCVFWWVQMCEQSFLLTHPEMKSLRFPTRREAVQTYNAIRETDFRNPEDPEEELKGLLKEKELYEMLEIVED